jgi:acetoacetate decarboxylase
MTTVRYGARTPEQLRNREVSAAKVGAWSTSLTATYRTAADIVAAVLPPPLEPTGDPVVKVSIATVDLGAGRPPFGAGTFAVQARHGDVVGFYPLLMPMTTEQAVIGGRETFGEPKKLAQVTLDRQGDQVTGRVARMGITIIELTGTVTGQLDLPEPRERTDFYFKFLMAPDGRGLDPDPHLAYCHRKETNRSHARVEGEVKLFESRFDPVADITVVGDVQMTLSERQSEQRGELIAPVRAEDLLPYVHQRYDDLSPTGKDD